MTIGADAFTRHFHFTGLMLAVLKEALCAELGTFY